MINKAFAQGPAWLNIITYDSQSWDGYSRDIPQIQQGHRFYIKSECQMI